MNQIETLVLQTIGENTSSPDVFLDTSAGMEPIRDSINDAIEEISMITGAAKQTYRIPLRDGQSFYRFKFTQDRFAYITDAWLWANKRRLDQTDFKKLESEDPRWMTIKGSPECYFQIGLNTVGFYPSPSGSTNVIELKCCFIPDRYSSDTDRVKMRESFKWATVHFAVSEYYASRGDRNEAMIHHNKYLELLGVQIGYPAAGDKTYTNTTDKAMWR